MNKTVIFDLDGTLYFGQQVAKEALDGVEILKSMGYRIVYLTNNSTQSRAQITQKLTYLGFRASQESVYTSSYATAKYISMHQIANKVFLLGEDGFAHELGSHDIATTEDLNEAQCIVIGLDFGISYDKISSALYGIETMGLPLIASNADKNYPGQDAIIKPGANMILSALLGSMDHDVDYVLTGKPNTFFLDIITNKYNITKDDIVVVGDGVASDIAMADKFGCRSLLVGDNGFCIEDANKIIETFEEL